MSNRPRRRLLREWQMRALVREGAAPPDPDSIQSLEEWNRLHRDAFRFLWREPLRSPNNTRPDAGLINMQARNEAEPFNPLTDPIPEPPAHLLESWDLKELWGQIEAAIDSALHYLAPSMTITRPHFIPDPAATPGPRVAPAWPGAPPGDMYFFEDYPARFYRVFRKLRTGMCAVHQYGDDGSPWFPDHGSAARNILNLDEWITKSWPHRPIKRITEPELYALLVLAAGWWALNELRRLPETWSREDLDYIAGKVQDAERWLAEAYRLKQSDAKQAEANTQITTMAPDAERGKEQRNRLILMGEKAKQESTLYPESDKAKWREHDQQAAKESGRPPNDSARVRAVIKKFGLPESAARTVRRALFNK